MNLVAGEVSELMRALANPHRLMLLCQLVEGEKSVGELAEALDLRQPTVSQHLALMRRDDLVRSRREGQVIRYRLGRPEVGRMMGFLYQTFCGPGAAAGPQADEAASDSKSE
ncbi:ArsR/SmtB family transcription factor [Marinibaculum pumilum]|uniref:ArsR/SmtB family transcription factor n=1 Tax=Marinibaculum pumilum TaxID=1766165 RepID=A0ABV7L696_9PROT